MTKPDPHLMTIFGEALERTAPDARDAYLAEACGGDADARRRVEDLLRAHDQVGGFLAGPETQASAVANPSITPMREAAGSVVGPYKLLEQIGEGGMGVVFLAEQQHPVRRQVALKVIKAGMDTRQVVARFEAERQALALMDHPNIAKVLDAGATDSGRPYFVMELVKGVPITRYCDEHQLNPRQRLELFVAVCQAVQHAHQKGVIHRDLKPSNVLVATYDGRPVPKVIDFGVAKATGGRLTEQTLFTGFGAVVGTPEYMSPEQAELNQLDVDTRSDVYALGVLLYELLTGSTPLERGRFKEAALLEMLRVVREEEPPRPSTRLSTTDKLPSIAASRGLEPRKLSGLVRGELDWIVMKALEKDRGRRYETASGFAADVGRYLADEPVLACPPSAGYRMRKFTRRHRAPIAIATAFVLLLVTAVVISAYQAIRIRAEQKKTLAQKADADRQGMAAQTSERVAQQRLAEGLTATGDALLAASEVLRARQAYDESIKIGEALSLPTTPATSGLAQSYFDSPPPLIKFYGAGKPILTTACAIAPDGRTVATGSPEGVVRLWDLLTGLPKGQLVGHTTLVRSLAFSRDGAALITASHDATARIWDVPSGKSFRTLSGHTHRVYTAALTLDGHHAVTGSEDGTVRIWDARTGEQLHVLDADSSPIWSVSISPDGRLIAAAGENASLIVWELRSGNRLFKVGTSAQVDCVAFTPDGTAVLTTEWSRNMTLWDVEKRKPVVRYGPTEGSVRMAAFLKDGSRFVTAGNDGMIRVWDTRSGAELSRTAVRNTAIPAIALTPDDRSALTPTSQVWDVSGQTDKTVVAHGGFRSCSVSPDGRLAVTSDGRGSLKLWDVATWELLAWLPGNAGRSCSVRFLPDGRRVVCACGDLVRMWDPLSGVVTEYHPTDSAGFAIAGSPDSRTVAFAQGENAITIFDLVAWKVVRTLACDEPMNSVAFSPDGTRLLTGHRTGGGDPGNDVILWDLASGKAIRALKRHRHWVQVLAFASDGKTAISGSWDQNVIVWDLEAGRVKHVLSGHTGRIRGLAVADNGTTVVSASDDGTVRLWDLRTGKQARSFALGAEVYSLARLAPDATSAITVDAAGRLRVWRFDWAREIRARDERVRKAQQTLQDRAGDPDALRELGEWYAYRGRWDWAGELLERARAGGATVSDVTLARCAWKSGRADDAVRLFTRAQAAGEVPAEYLRLCANAPRRWDIELADLTRAIEQAPFDAKVHRARGVFLYQAGRFREAANDLERVTALDPDDHDNWYEAATLYAWLGDVGRYRRACGEMLDRFGGAAAGDTDIAERTAKSCALAPGAVPDLSRVVRLADHCVTGTETHPGRRWYLLAKGLTEYRAGRDESALRWLERFAPEANGTHFDASGFATLALAYHRLGQTNAARRSLDAARAIVAKKPDDALLDWQWRDWLQCQTLIREAVRAVGDPSRPTTSPATRPAATATMPQR